MNVATQTGRDPRLMAYLDLEMPIAELEHILRAADFCFTNARRDDEDLFTSAKFLVEKAREMSTALTKRYDEISAIGFRP